MFCFYALVRTPLKCFPKLEISRPSGIHLWEAPFDYKQEMAFPNSGSRARPFQDWAFDCPPFLLLSVWCFIFSWTQRQLHASCFIFSSLNARPPCPSCSEPNVLEDSQGLAAEGNLTRYSLHPTCMSQCLCWGTVCFLSSPSFPLPHPWLSPLFSLSCHSFFLFLFFINDQTCKSKVQMSRYSCELFPVRNLDWLRAFGVGRAKAN